MNIYPELKPFLYWKKFHDGGSHVGNCQTATHEKRQSPQLKHPRVKRWKPPRATGEEKEAKGYGEGGCLPATRLEDFEPFRVRGHQLVQYWDSNRHFLANATR